MSGNWLLHRKHHAVLSLGIAALSLATACSKTPRGERMKAKTRDAHGLVLRANLHVTDASMDASYEIENTTTKTWLVIDRMPATLSAGVTVASCPPISVCTQPG